MARWKRKQQEREGTYLFSGIFYVTQGVLAKLTDTEIVAIYLDLQAFVKEKSGIDYLQVYENDDGEKLFFIDQCNPEMMAEGTFKKEDNHCTLLLANEY